MRILTWNLKHGRSVPSSGRDLFEEFAAAIAGWEWDVALLQEVPPWWPHPLASRLGVHQRHVLTSRNALLAVRRAIAVRWPDLIKSNGGGANAILSRQLPREHRAQRLSWLPERRWVHAIRIGERWVANLHTDADPDQVRRAALNAAGWAGDLPLILGGDFNLRQPVLPGLRRAGGHEVDHVFAGAGIQTVSCEALDSGWLSDHPPVLVALEP